MHENNRPVVSTRRVSQRALRRFAAPAILASMAGCSVESMEAPEYQSSADDRQATALMRLEALGFDTTGAQFLEEDDEVVVEEDLLFSVEALVQSEEPGLREEGYRYGTLAGNGNAFTFHLEFDSDVPTGWVNEFKAAAAKYGAASSKITYSTSGTGWPIRIQASGFTTGHPLFPEPNTWTYARAGFPTMGMPYPKIVINTNRDNSDCDPAGSIPPQKTRRTVAMHELGHTIGFVHPRDHDERHHITGTASCGFDYSKMPPVDMCKKSNNPNLHHSVMNQGMSCDKDSSRIYWDLTSDDKLSIEKIWGR